MWHYGHQWAEFPSSGFWVEPSGKVCNLLERLHVFPVEPPPSVHCTPVTQQWFQVEEILNRAQAESTRLLCSHCSVLEKAPEAEDVAW